MDRPVFRVLQVLLEATALEETPELLELLFLVQLVQQEPRAAAEASLDSRVRRDSRPLVPLEPRERTVARVTLELREQRVSPSRDQAEAREALARRERLVLGAALAETARVEPQDRLVLSVPRE